MFTPLIDSGRRLAARVNRYLDVHIKDIPPEERMLTGEFHGWFKAAETLIASAFGTQSSEMTRWKALQKNLHEKASREIDAAPPGERWDRGRHDMESINRSILLLTEFENLLESSLAATATPPEIRHSLASFQADHPDPRKVAFVMMRFGATSAHENIAAAMRSALAPLGISAVRADDKQYHDDLLWNILTYVHGCGFGIAVFERIETEQFNPNVALEVGYMLALRKPVCLLKDRTLPTLHADLVGKLYRVFDPLEPIRTIPKELSAWLRDKGWKPRVLGKAGRGAAAAQTLAAGTPAGRMQRKAPGRRKRRR
jgi:hypothetical protein